jgi:hypothetical protein
MTLIAVAPIVIGLALTPATGAAALDSYLTSPDTVKATGTFSFTTANGILPTWSDENLALIGVSPGSVVTSATSTTARVRLPIVAKTGSANAAAGGFRINNVDTNASVRCSNPVIDTRARVLDCVLADGSNLELFEIAGIKSRSVTYGGSTVTWVYRGVQLRLNGQGMADYLNDELGTYTFSPSVTIATGDLVVTRDK